jgi:uncharacterized membrane protein YccC
LKFNNQFNGQEFQNNDSTPIGPKIAFFGSILTVIGDTLAVIGGAISLEEDKIADQQQQQAMADLQRQIDDLKQNNGMTIDVDTFNNVLEKILDKLEAMDNAKLENKPKNEYRN